jgi:hypothetical protein
MYFLLWPQIKLHFRVHPETVWHFDSKERLNEIYVPSHLVSRVQS